jgi:hypothetical protein
MWFKIDKDRKFVDFYMEDEYGKIVHDCMTFKETHTFFEYLKKEMTR